MIVFRKMIKSWIVSSRKIKLAIYKVTAFDVSVTMFDLEKLFDK